VPVEPPPSRWALPTAGAFRGRDDLVGVGADLEERVDLLARMNVDAIAIDTAHGHSRQVIAMVAKLKAETTVDVQVTLPHGGGTVVEKGVRADRRHTIAARSPSGR